MTNYPDKVEFEIGALVYRKTNPEVVGIITGILFRPTGVGYYIKFADEIEEHCYGIELTTDKGVTV